MSALPKRPSFWNVFMEEAHPVMSLLEETVLIRATSLHVPIQLSARYRLLTCAPLCLYAPQYPSFCFICVSL